MGTPILQQWQREKKVLYKGTVGDDEYCVEKQITRAEFPKLDVVSRWVLLPPQYAIRNHSPTGFSWGYLGSGPAQLALALMMDFTNEESFVLHHYQMFKEKVVANFDIKKDWTITGEEMMQYMEPYWEQDAGDANQPSTMPPCPNCNETENVYPDNLVGKGYFVCVNCGEGETGYEFKIESEIMLPCPKCNTNKDVVPSNHNSEHFLCKTCGTGFHYKDFIKPQCPDELGAVSCDFILWAGLFVGIGFSLGVFVTGLIFNLH